MGTIKKLYQDQLVGGSGGTGQEVYPVTSTLGVYDTDNNQLQGVLDKFTTNLGLFTCGTSAATAAKTVSASKFALMEGGSVKIKFTYANSAASPTLAIGTTAAKPIIYNGAAASASNSWEAGETVEFYHDGTNWVGRTTTPVTQEQLNQLGQEAIYDVSARNGGATFASLSALLSSENLSTLIPIAVRCGGMSIRFVQSSDNKYVQYRLVADEWSTVVSNWQSENADDEPIAGSKNLVKSGGVVAAFKKIDLASTNTYYGIINIISDISFTSATLKQYYNRDRQSTPAQYSQVIRIDFVTDANEILTFIYSYEGGPQLTGIQELTKTISGHTITIRVDWQPINAAPDISIDITRVINTTNYNTKIQEKSNSFIFKDSSVSIDFGIKSIYTDFEFSSIRLSQYYNRDKTSQPAVSSQVLVFYVLIDGTEQRFVYTFEGGPQLTGNQDIELVNNGKHIYVNLDWKAINQELSNYYLLKGNIQQLYKLPTEVIKESDFSLVPGINIANPSNIIGKAAIDVREGILVIRDNLDGNFVIKIDVSEGQVISFGHFTLGRYGAYTFYNGTTPVGNFNTFLDPQGGKAATVTVPSGANILYIQVHNSDYPSADYSQIMANYGNDLANYEPFEEEIELIKGYKIKGTGESQGQYLSQLVIDLPISDGTDIQSGYAYIDSSTRNVKVKA